MGTESPTNANSLASGNANVYPSAPEVEAGLCVCIGYLFFVGTMLCSKGRFVETDFGS